jgi:hypothetical protein
LFLYVHCLHFYCKPILGRVKLRFTLSVGVPPTELTILFGWWDTNQ